jgi:hypothetical protein
MCVYWESKYCAITYLILVQIIFLSRKVWNDACLIKMKIWLDWQGLLLKSFSGVIKTEWVIRQFNITLKAGKIEILKNISYIHFVKITMASECNQADFPIELDSKLFMITWLPCPLKGGWDGHVQQYKLR